MVNEEPMFEEGAEDEAKRQEYLKEAKKCEAIPEGPERDKCFTDLQEKYYPIG